jgi:hypothetical protein
LLYGLRFVPDHPVYRLQDGFGYFLEDGLECIAFGPHCFPEWFRPVLSASSGLRQRCRDVHREARKQNQAVRNSIVAVWTSQGDVQALCENVRRKLNTWGFKAQDLIDALCTLFNFLYDETLESKSFEHAAGRSLLDHYNAFRALGQRVCPFCGLNYYADRDGGARSGYDHFLPRVHYPLAAVNFRNLVPMCDDCNEPPRKGTKDVLFGDKGRKTRRRFYYPYSKPGGVEFSVQCTQRPKPSNVTGTWKVRVKPMRPAEKELVSGWDSVFGVQIRFSARVREGLEGWMKDFLSSRDYKTPPSLAQLRKDLLAKAVWLSKSEQLRTKAEAAPQAAAFRYMAEDAPDDMLGGYAAIATSAAVVEIPTALGRS